MPEKGHFTYKYKGREASEQDILNHAFAWAQNMKKAKKDFVEMDLRADEMTKGDMMQIKEAYLKAHPKIDRNYMSGEDFWEHTNNMLRPPDDSKTEYQEAEYRPGNLFRVAKDIDEWKEYKSGMFDRNAKVVPITSHRVGEFRNGKQLKDDNSPDGLKWVSQSYIQDGGYYIKPDGSFAFGECEGCKFVAYSGNNERFINVANSIRNREFKGSITTNMSRDMFVWGGNRTNPNHTVVNGQYSINDDKLLKSLSLLTGLDIGWMQEASLEAIKDQLTRGSNGTFDSGPWMPLGGEGDYEKKKFKEKRKEASGRALESIHAVLAQLYQNPLQSDIEMGAPKFTWTFNKGNYIEFNSTSPDDVLRNVFSVHVTDLHEGFTFVEYAPNEVAKTNAKFGDELILVDKKDTKEKAVIGSERNWTFNMGTATEKEITAAYGISQKVMDYCKKTGKGCYRFLHDGGTFGYVPHLSKEAEAELRTAFPNEYIKYGLDSELEDEKEETRKQKWLDGLGIKQNPDESIEEFTERKRDIMALYGSQYDLSLEFEKTELKYSLTLEEFSDEWVDIKSKYTAGSNASATDKLYVNKILNFQWNNSWIKNTKDGSKTKDSWEKDVVNGLGRSGLVDVVSFQGDFCTYKEGTKEISGDCGAKWFTGAGAQIRYGKVTSITREMEVDNDSMFFVTEWNRGENNILVVNKETLHAIEIRLGMFGGKTSLEQVDRYIQAFVDGQLEEESDRMFDKSTGGFDPTYFSDTLVNRRKDQEANMATEDVYKIEVITGISGNQSDGHGNSASYMLNKYHKDAGQGRWNERNWKAGGKDGHFAVLLGNEFSDVIGDRAETKTLNREDADNLYRIIKEESKKLIVDQTGGSRTWRYVDDGNGNKVFEIGYMEDGKWIKDAGMAIDYDKIQDTEEMVIDIYEAITDRFDDLGFYLGIDEFNLMIGLGNSTQDGLLNAARNELVNLAGQEDIKAYLESGYIDASMHTNIWKFNDEANNKYASDVLLQQYNLGGTLKQGIHDIINGRKNSANEWIDRGRKYYEAQEWRLLDQIERLRNPNSKEFKEYSEFRDKKGKPYEDPQALIDAEIGRLNKKIVELQEIQDTYNEQLHELTGSVGYAGSSFYIDGKTSKNDGDIERAHQRKNNREIGYREARTGGIMAMESYLIENPQLTDQEAHQMYFQYMTQEKREWDAMAQNSFVSIDITHNSPWMNMVYGTDLVLGGNVQYAYERRLVDLVKNKYGWDGKSKGNLRVSVYDLLEADIDVRNFEGWFNLDMIHMNEHDRNVLESYEDSRDLLDGRIRATYEMAYLDLNPVMLKRPDVGHLFINSAVRAFETGWFGQSHSESLGLHDKEYDISPYLDVVQELEGSINQFSQNYNEEIYNQADQGIFDKNTVIMPEFKWTKEHKENFERTTAEQVAEGAGAFMPMLVEFAAIELLTLGTGTALGITRALAKTRQTISTYKKLTKAQRLVAAGKGLKGYTRAGNAWNRTKIGLTGLIHEEMKMQLLGFKPGSGAAFYTGGALTQWMKFPLVSSSSWMKTRAMGGKLPVSISGGYNKMAGMLNMPWTKMIKPGIVGAASMEFASILELKLETMGGGVTGKNFDMEMQDLFGDTSEVTQRLITNSLMFSVLGQMPNVVHGKGFMKTHWTKKDFDPFFKHKWGVQKNKVAYTELDNKKEKLYNESEGGGDKDLSREKQRKNITHRLINSREKLSKEKDPGKRAKLKQEIVRDQLTLQKIKKYLKLSNKQRRKHDAIEEIQRDIKALYIDITRQNKFDLNIMEQKDVEANIEKMVMNPFNDVMEAIHPAEKGKYRRLEFELVDPGHKGLIVEGKEATASFDGEEFKVYFDKSKFNAGKMSHEVFIHAALDGIAKAQPSQFRKFGESFMGKFEKIVSKETLLDKNLKKEMDKYYSEEKKPEEMIAFVAEMLTNPAIYYSEVAPTLLKELKHDLLSFVEETTSWAPKGTGKMNVQKFIELLGRLGKSTGEGGRIKGKLKKVAEYMQSDFMGVNFAEKLTKTEQAKVASFDLLTEHQTLINRIKRVVKEKNPGWEIVHEDLKRDIVDLKKNGVSEKNILRSRRNAVNIDAFKEGTKNLVNNKQYEKLVNLEKEAKKELKKDPDNQDLKTALANAVKARTDFKKSEFDASGVTKAENQLLEDNAGYIQKMLDQKPGGVEISDWISATKEEVTKIMMTYNKEVNTSFGAYLMDILIGGPTSPSPVGRWENVLKNLKQPTETISYDAFEGGASSVKTAYNFQETGSSRKFTDTQWIGGGTKLRNELKKNGELILNSPTVKKMEQGVLKLHKNKKIDLNTMDFRSYKKIASEIIPKEGIYGISTGGTPKENFTNTLLQKVQGIYDNFNATDLGMPKVNTFLKIKGEVSPSAHLEGRSNQLEKVLLDGVYYETIGSRTASAETGEAAGNPIQMKLELTVKEFLEKAGVEINETKEGVTFDVSKVKSQSAEHRLILGYEKQVGRMVADQVTREMGEKGMLPLETLTKITEQQLLDNLMSPNPGKFAAYDLLEKAEKIKKYELETLRLYNDAQLYDSYITFKNDPTKFVKNNPKLGAIFSERIEGLAYELAVAKSGRFEGDKIIAAEGEGKFISEMVDIFSQEKGKEYLTDKDAPWRKNDNITTKLMNNIFLEILGQVYIPGVPILKQLAIGNFHSNVNSKYGGKGSKELWKDKGIEIAANDIVNKDFFGKNNKRAQSILKRLSELKITDGMFQAYASSGNTATKRQLEIIVDSKNAKQAKKKQVDFMREHYKKNPPGEVAEFGRLMYELFEIYIHDVKKGKNGSKFSQKQREQFVLWNGRNNTNSGTTGFRTTAPVKSFRLLDYNTFKDFKNRTFTIAGKEFSWGTLPDAPAKGVNAGVPFTETQKMNLFIRGISKFEHVMSSGEHSQVAAEHVFKNTYGTKGYKTTLEKWGGMKGLEYEFSLVDNMFGTNSKAGIYRFVEQWDVLKNTILVNKDFIDGKLPTLFDQYVKELGPEKIQEIKDFVDGVKKAGEKNKIAAEKLGGKASHLSEKQILGKLGKIDKAIDNARSLKKERKGISVWDFDDTLAYTKSGVRYTLPNPSGKPQPKKKVIFLAGGPGSGKSNVVKKLRLEDMGFKIVNQDISLEWLMKNHGLPSDMREFTDIQKSKFSLLTWKAREIALKKQAKYQGKGDGVVVDGTGANLKTMNNLVTEFKNKGYDVQMLMVNTSLETAIARNKARPERSLRDFIVRETWEKVQANKEAYKALFGEQFAEVFTDNLKQGDKMPTALTDQMHEYIGGYIKGRLNAGEYADKGMGLKDKGAKFDFTEFDYIKEGEKGPFFEKAQKRIEKFGNKHQYILTARPQVSELAIHLWLDRMGLKIPAKNIKALGNSAAEAKADWMIEKAGEGYNDFYFADDAIQNVEAVKNALNILDVKSVVQQAKRKASFEMDKEFNQILEGTLGVEWRKEFSDVQAQIKGKKKGRFNYIMAPSAQDFKGLLYSFLGKGKKGEAQMQWFEEKLIKPFARGQNDLNSHKQTIRNDHLALNKAFKDVKFILTEPAVEGSNFTVEQAIRVHRWTESGYEIPGLSKRDAKMLNDVVNKEADLKAYSESLGQLTKLERGYSSPSEHWLAEGILTDLNIIGDKLARKSYLKEFIENKSVIFSKKNLNKIEAEFGSKFREALEDSVWAMETGQTRKEGSNRLVNKYMDWVNNSVGVIMFANMRSAALQTISSMNYINWKENNPLMAAKAFANLPQFGKDFAKIFNSDMLKQRRSGLKQGVNEKELADALIGSKGSPKAALAWLLKKGFLPTQIADSFAISMGGSSYYRNRINMYKKQGLSDKKAEKKAWLDFQETTEVSQQSSRADLISQQQRSPLGRLILAFGNTPMQYARIMNKAARDLANNRGDMKHNVSKIAYYGVLQSAMFTALQSFLTGFSIDEKDEDYDKSIGLLNGMVNNTLRGFGLGGVMVSTLKDTSLQFHKQQKKKMPDHAYTLLQALNFSPPIGSKARKLYSATQTWKYDEELIKEMGLDIDNPGNLAVANVISAFTNVPLDRLVMKLDNIREALDSRNSMIQRIASGMGWSKWVTGVQNERLIAFEEDFKETQKIEKKEIKTQEKVNKKLEELRLKYPDLNDKQIKKKIELEDKSKDLFNLSKREQVKLLKALDVDPDDYKKEADRVNKIIELYQSDSARTETTIQTHEEYVPTKEEKREEDLFKTTKKDQVNLLMDLGLSTKKINKLKYEQDRINMIIKLQNKKKKRELELVE